MANTRAKHARQDDAETYGEGSSDVLMEQALAEADAALDDPDGPAVLYIRNVPVLDVKALRAKMGLTQKAFSEQFGFSLGAVRHWEQHKRLPDRASRILLHIIQEDPKRVERIAREMF